MTMVLGCENISECDNFIAAKCAQRTNNPQLDCAHVLSMPLNLTDRSSVEHFSDSIHTKYTRLDYLIIDMVTNESQRNYFNYLGQFVLCYVV